MTGTESAGSGPVGLTAQAELPSSRRWRAVAWFIAGIFAGGIGFAAYSQLITPQPVAALDVTAVSIAARDGALDAIATMQAGGSPDGSRATSTPVVVRAAIAARPANQMGSNDAPVTFVEFSDFQ
jgi:hypothetical protein